MKDELIIKWEKNPSVWGTWIDQKIMLDTFVEQSRFGFGVDSIEVFVHISDSIFWQKKHMDFKRRQIKLTKTQKKKIVYKFFKCKFYAENKLTGILIGTSHIEHLIFSQWL